MIISKLQQFIIFNCDQSETTIPDSLKDKISKITKINPPTGSSLVTWSDGAPVQQLNTFTPNTIYLITSKEGQLGYELAGAVDPATYCLSNVPSIVDESRYKGDFFKIIKDDEEIIVELTQLSESFGKDSIYLKGKAVKIPKLYNKPWSFHITDLSFVKDLPNGYYDLKPSTVEQLLESNQEIIVIYQLSSLDKIPLVGVSGCGAPLIWECDKQINLNNQSELIGFCSGECPEGYEKTSYDFNLMEYCIPILDSDLNSDSDSDDFILDFEKDFDSDNNLIIDYDSDSDTYYDSDSDSEVDSDSDSDLPQYSGPELTDLYLINEILKDETLPQELRDYFTSLLERIQNG